MLVMLLLIFTSGVMCQGTCPPISVVTVNLSFSVEEDGRQFACSGEPVTFICKVNRSRYVRVAAGNFKCRNDPFMYISSDSPGRTFTTSNDTFQANLTNLQSESNQSNFTVTLTANATNETNNTVIECADQLDSIRVQRKTLIQSAPPSPPTGLNYTAECNDPSNTSQRLANGSTLITRTCQSYDVVLTWDDANGMFDLLHYSVNVLGNITNVTTTSHIVRVLPDKKYLVLIRTVSKCQQTSSATALHVNVTAAGSTTETVPSVENTYCINGSILGGILGATIIISNIIGLIIGCVGRDMWQRRKEKKQEQSR